MESPPPPPPNSPILRTLNVVPYVACAAASGILVLMALQHLGKAIFRRLWLFPCYPVKFLAINAATLALLSIAAKPPKMLFSGEEILPDFFHLFGSVLVCALIGACMPSLATANSSDMWSNTAGAGLLLLTVLFDVLIHVGSAQADSLLTNSMLSNSFVRHSYMIVASCMIALLLVLLTQALALEAMMADVGACVTIQLKKLEYMDGAIMRERSWEALEHKTCIMLMMVLTSNPQNVASRSPSAAIVGALVFSAIMLLLVKLGIQELAASYCMPPGPMLLFGIVCVLRWLRVAFHDNRPVRSLLCAAEPSYWGRKVNTFWLRLKTGPTRQRQPGIWQQVKYGFKALLYSIAAFIMLCFIIPIHWLLVACIRFTHIVSSLLLRLLIGLPLKLIQLLISWLPTRALYSLCLKWIEPRCSRRVVSAETELALRAGVICLAGEDPRIVWREFEGAAKLIIRRQVKKAQTKTDLRALETLLRRSDRACVFDNSAVLDVLGQKGAPTSVDMLHVGHTYEYGWSLTAILLLLVMRDIEVEALGTHKAYKAAMDAYKQALEMVKVVDEMYLPVSCSKETYLDATASVWIKLLKSKKCRSRFVSPMDILEALLDSATNHIDEFNKTQMRCTIQAVAAWPINVVVSYTMYTVCQNVRRWWMSAMASGPGGTHSSNAEAMVVHLNYLMAEVLAGCLSNLPGVLNMTMAEAVCKGDIAKIETGILLICQGQELWEKLQWPAPRCPTHTLGQLNQWLQTSAVADIFQ